MAPDQADASGAAPPRAARDHMKWSQDVVAIASAGLVAMATHTALLVHGRLTWTSSIAIAVLMFCVLVGVHVALRPRSAKFAPQLTRVQHRRVRRSATVEEAKAKPPVSDGFAAVLAHAEAETRGQPQPQPQPQPRAVEPTELAKALVAAARAPTPRTADADRTPALATAAGFEHLQSLVAELARATPGPKAMTPDPDRPRPVAEMAASHRTYSEAMEQANVAQAAALGQAARVMSAPGPTGAGTSRGVAAELVDALTADRMTVYLEPIQQIEAGRPRHYEVFVRFKTAAGAELPHQELLAAARDAGLLPRVDAAVLPRAARIAQHFQLRGRDTEILSRVHGVSLADHDFRTEVTAATIAADGAALVLSFAQSDVRAFGRIHWDILATIADMGLRFAIESVTDLDMDFEALKQRGFDFVKLDAGVLIDGLPAAGGLIASADVCRHFASLGLALVVNHVDDEQALARILGFGVLFGQGALFGSRRAVRADILTSAVAA